MVESVAFAKFRKKIDDIISEHMLSNSDLEIAQNELIEHMKKVKCSDEVQTALLYVIGVLETKKAKDEVDYGCG